MRACRFRFVSLVLLAIVFGCDDTNSTDPEDDAGADAATSDAGESDAATNDAGLADSGPSDAGESDASTSDAGESDASTSDAGESDASAPTCVGVVCDPSAHCSIASGTAACECNGDFQDNDHDGICSESCESSCANGTCDDSSGTLQCTCATDYVFFDDEGQCVPSCAALTCGTNSVCSDAEDRGICGCLDGARDYDEDGNCDFCRPVVALVTAGPGVTTSNPYHAIDDSLSTLYSGLDQNMPYLTFDYGASESPVIVAYTLFGQTNDPTNVFGFELLGSTDGTSWTNLDTRFSEIAAPDVPMYFETANTTGYRYYRFNLFSANYNYIRVQELVLHDCQ